MKNGLPFQKFEVKIELVLIGANILIKEIVFGICELSSLHFEEWLLDETLLENSTFVEHSLDKCFLTLDL